MMELASDRAMKAPKGTLQARAAVQPVGDWPVFNATFDPAVFRFVRGELVGSRDVVAYSAGRGELLENRVRALEHIMSQIAATTTHSPDLDDAFAFTVGHALAKRGHRTFIESARKRAPIVWVVMSSFDEERQRSVFEQEVKIFEATGADADVRIFDTAAPDFCAPARWLPIHPRG